MSAPIEELDPDTIVYCPVWRGFGDLYRASDTAFVSRIHYAKYFWALLCLAAFFLIGWGVVVPFILAVYLVGSLSLRAQMRRKRIGKTRAPSWAEVWTAYADLSPTRLTTAILVLGSSMTVAGLVAAVLALWSGNPTDATYNGAVMAYAALCTWIGWTSRKRGRDVRPKAGSIE